jgi:hypothetical protein
MVDLGDTSRTLGPFVVSTQPKQLPSEDPSEDQTLLLLTHTELPAPVVDLRRRSKFRESHSCLGSA